MRLRAEDRAVWLVGIQGRTPEAAAMLSAYLQDDHYRATFKRAVEAQYRTVGDNPQAVQVLDKAYDAAIAMVRAVEAKEQASAAPATPAAPVAADLAPEHKARQTIRGELLACGPAPYQFKEENQMSYFATVRTEQGERTLWEVGLEDTLASAQPQRGDHVNIEDLGTQAVTVWGKDAQGQAVEKQVQRREWGIERVGPQQAHDRQAPKPGMSH